MRLKQSITWLVLALSLAVTSASRTWAAPTTIKVATLVPEGTVWHKTIADMGDTWSRDTQARVAMRLYAGGVAGDEPDMVRKMRIGQLNGAVLTVLGLSDLDDAFLVFTVPML